MSILRVIAALDGIIAKLQGGTGKATYALAVIASFMRMVSVVGRIVAPLPCATGFVTLHCP